MGESVIHQSSACDFLSSYLGNTPFAYGSGEGQKFKTCVVNGSCDILRSPPIGPIIAFHSSLSPMTSSRIRRYLDCYAEAIATEIQDDLQTALSRTYCHVLVIPLFDEALKCLDTVLPEDISDTLVIVVVNAAVDADPGAQLRTQAFLAQFQPQDQRPFSVVHRQAGTTLLLLDCCTSQRQLPPKQGVGLARKIGADVALACIDQGIVETPWIRCTDGDAILPKGYFDTPELDADVAVAIYPFAHQPIHDAILRYEISLRYYVTALAKAGSPYAFQTIGSLLNINANHYAMVRGFPKRQAAEDFYMLNKLAKTGKVIRLKHPLVSLSSRISRRVPFGTGAAIARLSAHEPLLLYHPHIFEQLQIWLGLSQRLWVQLPAYLRQHTDVKASLQAWWQQQHLSDSLLTALLHLKVDGALEQAFQQCRDFPHFQFFLWVWFDAFRTLKFVHYYRDRLWPSLSIEATMAITDAPQTLDPLQPLSLTEIQSQGNPTHLSTHLLNILERLRQEEQNLPLEIGVTVCQALDLR
ncbi:MAG: hypothetical protein HC790_00740 [Acaryochloridaceae cyanobacterium CSU_3_4]|nr:hypothetical protein [Acaryochloridaceae cyanobacterium CSU_3_4]